MKKREALLKNKKHITKDLVEEEEFSSSKSDSFKRERKKNRQRKENSLGELTKNFIKYIKEKGGENNININDVVKKLRVKKRRIYDITNVLEGNLNIFHLKILL